MNLCILWSPGCKKVGIWSFDPQLPWVCRPCLLSTYPIRTVYLGASLHRHRKNAKYCVILSVYLPACDDISDITLLNFSIFYAFCLWSWFGPSLLALHLVLWMTSSFHVMDPMARHVIRMPITRQRFYLDLRSLYKTNRKSYPVNQMQPP